MFSAVSLDAEQSHPDRESSGSRPIPYPDVFQLDLLTACFSTILGERAFRHIRCTRGREECVSCHPRVRKGTLVTEVDCSSAQPDGHQLTVKNLAGVQAHLRSWGIRDRGVEAVPNLVP